MTAKKTMSERFSELKKSSRKGCSITSIEALLKEENVYYHKSFVPVEFLKTWKLGRILEALKCNSFSYAFPNNSFTTRFSDEDVLHIEERLGWSHTFESRSEIIRILHDYDQGRGDADDIIDTYEDDCLEYANCDGFPIDET